jgi:hypothetical protein
MSRSLRLVYRISVDASIQSLESFIPAQRHCWAFSLAPVDGEITSLPSTWLTNQGIGRSNSYLTITKIRRNRRTVPSATVIARAQH